eukprot:4035660-Alexandrium_andersonii.AAC.1
MHESIRTHACMHGKGLSQSGATYGRPGQPSGQVRSAPRIQPEGVAGPAHQAGQAARSAA